MRFSGFLRSLLLGAPIVVFCSTGASADFSAAKAAYERLPPDEQAAVTINLIATGDFNGFHRNGFSERYYRAILAFEKRERLFEDGIIADDELSLLKSRADKFFGEIGLKKYIHPIVGSAAYIPRSLFDREKQYEKGIAFETTDKRLSLSFSAHSVNDKTFVDLFELLSTPSYNRSVSYKRMKDSFFVVNGDYKGRDFYTYMERISYGSTGFTLTWKREIGPLASRLATLMANGFSAGTQSAPIVEDESVSLPKSAQPQPPTTTSPKPVSSTGTGFKVNAAGHILTNYHVAGDCKIVRLRKQGELPMTAELVAGDSTNDLALLKPLTPIGGTAARFRIGDPPQSGSDIVLFGFPLSSILSSSGNTVTGNISSLAGLWE